MSGKGQSNGGADGASNNLDTSGSPEPIQISGSAITSFDELESVQRLDQSGPSGKDSSGSKSKSSKPKKEAKSEKQKDDSEKGESDDDGEQGEVESQVEDEQEVNKSDKEDKTDKGAKEKAKVFKVRSGDKEVELRSDTPFEVTIDGKKTPVPLQDLLNNYSGKVRYEQKFSEIDKERKTLQSEREAFHNDKSQIDKGFEKLANLAKSEDREAAVWEFCETLGVEPTEFLEGFKKQLMPFVEELASLSPEERKSRELEDKVKLYDRKREIDKKRTEEVKARDSEKAHLAELGKRKNAVLEQNKITEAQFWETYEELKTSGKIDPKDIDPELVGMWFSHKNSEKEIGSILDGINPEFQGKAQAIKDLQKTMIDNGFTLEEMKDIAAEVYGSNGSKRLAKKLSRGQSDGRPSAAHKTNTPVTFDDI